ncbi:hypothetical protein [Streptomyces sp. NPDC005435]|uniref:hypothetical protein n=1 Tax=Streptomyces sp. NPDC005435 TaxID=3154464 RepID=UPI0034534D58
MILVWPEFDLFGDLNDLTSGAPFTNSGPETLFDALSRTAIDWHGTTACATGSAPCDLSAHVLTDLGHFTSRDELFTHHGQTLCVLARLLAEPVLGRRSAGA